MTQGTGEGSRGVDQVLAEWGDALFRRRRHSGEDGESGSFGRSGHTAGRAGKGAGAQVPGPRMSPAAVRNAVREVIRPGARQVVIKITGGGKGFKAMAAHARYISRQGKDAVGGPGRTLEVTDELGQRHQGTQAVRQLIEDWRTSGSYIPDDSHRKEAFNIIFSMPKDTRPEALQAAVADTAAQLFEGHRYGMVMHLDQGAPHVHVMVRAERKDGTGSIHARPIWIGGARRLLVSFRRAESMLWRPGRWRGCATVCSRRSGRSMRRGKGD